MSRVRTISMPATAMALLAAITGGPAWAGETRNGETNAVAASDGGPIVVTAQLRKQALQSVPIAVQVISAAAIARHAADDIAGVAAFVPGFAIDASSPTQPHVTVRGITSTDFGIGTDPAVGVYVDGIYAGRSGGVVTEFSDLARIEVLKGPQGTLFGRNSAAGAVAIVTNKPGDRFEAALNLRAGNYGKKRVEGLINLPLGQDLALRINGVFNDRNGLYRDAATGERRNRQHAWAARGQLRWAPGTGTEIILAYIHDQIDQDARPSFGVAAIPPAPGRPVAGAPASTWIDPLTAPLMNDAIGNGERRSLNEVSLRAEHNLGGVRLNTITDWRQFNSYNREDEDGTARPDLYADTANIEGNTAFYQELRLSGQSPLLDWLAGASFSDEKARQTSQLNATTTSVDTILANSGIGMPFHALQNGLIDPYGLPFQVLDQAWSEAMNDHGHYTAWAGFGDAIWHVAPTVNLTTGLRYTRDIKHFTWLNGPRSAPGLDAALAGLDALGLLDLAGLSRQALTFDVVWDLRNYAGVRCDNGVNVTESVPCDLRLASSNLSPRAVIDWHPVPSVMLFASYARGYKAGGFTAAQPGSHFRNEIVDNFEAGMKGDFPRLGLMLNLSAFHYVYNNRQSLRLATPPGALVPEYVTDTSDEAAWGADLDTRWAPRGLPVQLYGNAQYIDAKFRRRVNPEGQTLTGQPTGVPLWRFAVGAQASRPIGHWGTFVADISHAYAGACRGNAESLAQGTCGGNVGAFTLGGVRQRTDLKLTATRGDGRFSVGFFAQNLFDNRYVEFVNMITASTVGTPYAVLSPPRTFGGEIGIKF